MYTDYVKTQAQALCHLFFHCCLKDGIFEKAELDDVSSLLVALDLHSDLNFTEEIKHYNAYRENIADEQTYVEELIRLIRPVNDLALYSYCIELMLSDSSFESSEEKLAGKIGVALGVEDAEQQTIKKLMSQRKVMETEKIC